MTESYREGMENTYGDIAVNIIADTHKICPKVHIIFNTLRDGQYPEICILMDRYDDNLEPLYKSLSDTSFHNNEVFILLKKLSAIGLYCIDLKPQNVVYRNTELEGLDVRLIDFDTDYCSPPKISTDLIKRNMVLYSLLLMYNRNSYHITGYRPFDSVLDTYPYDREEAVDFLKTDPIIKETLDNYQGIEL